MIPGLDASMKKVNASESADHGSHSTNFRKCTLVDDSTLQAIQVSLRTMATLTLIVAKSWSFPTVLV